MRKHHVINGAIAMIIAMIVSIATFAVVTGPLNASAAGKATNACFNWNTGHVFLRSSCNSKTEKRVLLNASGLLGATGPRGFSNFELAQQNGFT